MSKDILTLKDWLKPIFDEKLTEVQGQLDFLRTSETSTKTIGEVLLSHLVLEKYIDEYVLSKHPDLVVMNYEKENFGKKIKLIKSFNQLSGLTIDAINAMTDIRNQLAHNLTIKPIELANKVKLQKFADRWFRGDERLTTINLEKDIGVYFRIVTYFILLELISITTMIKGQKKIDEHYLEWQKNALESLLKDFKVEE